MVGNQSKEKRCIRCGEVKPLDDFAIASACKDGHTGACKECLYKAARVYWFNQHRERMPWRIAPDVSVCMFCGKQFRSINGKRRYCSDACKKRMELSRARERAARDGS